MLRKALSLKRFPYKSGCACSEKWGRPSTFALLFTRLGGHAPKSWTAAGLARAFFIRFYRFLGGYTPKKHWIFSRETGWSCSEFCNEWCVRDGITGDVMFYHDRGSRGHHVAREILGGYRGNVQSDGYEAYEQFERMEGITMYGCWAHARRKFVDALQEDERMAAEAILYIRKLYKVEEDADNAVLSPDERKEQRLKISYPTLRDFEKWMEDTYTNVLPKSKLGAAIAYTYSLLPRLSRYVNDGRVNIDNNLIENAIRPLALGRLCCTPHNLPYVGNTIMLAL